MTPLRLLTGRTVLTAMAENGIERAFRSHGPSVASELISLEGKLLYAPVAGEHFCNCCRRSGPHAPCCSLTDTAVMRNMRVAGRLLTLMHR